MKGQYSDDLRRVKQEVFDTSTRVSLQDGTHILFGGLLSASRVRKAGNNSWEMHPQGDHLLFTFGSVDGGNSPLVEALKGKTGVVLPLDMVAHVGDNDQTYPPEEWQLGEQPHP